MRHQVARVLGACGLTAGLLSGAGLASNGVALAAPASSGRVSSVPPPTHIGSAPWHVVASPKGTAGLLGVSCTGPHWCLAVGALGSSVWNGSSWGPLAKFPVLLQVGGVSCWAPGNCLVAARTQFVESRVLQLHNHKWHIVHVPGEVHAMLTNVSCVKGGDCMVIGASSAFHRVKGVWRRTALPTGDDADLTSVSCTSATDCMVVGPVARREGASFTSVALRWNGSHWTRTNLRALNARRVDRAQGPELQSVSCTSATSCMAVGVYGAEGEAWTGGSRMVSVRWNGRRWVDISSARQMTAGNMSVVCQESACTAVGGYVSSAKGGVLVERWTGKGWRSLVHGAHDGTANLDAVAYAGDNQIAVGGRGVGFPDPEPLVWEK